ncbi:CAP family protein [Altererythrobacter sp. MF3-039]|uniref:CAP family protein n=1 Tax=Altererythrobacter sp. MF3-039 TaxID=3252901 RepID=UPI00390C5088
MKKSVLGILAAGAAGLAAFTMPSSAQTTPNSFAAQLLLYHNVERKSLGRQPLSWSNKLAKDAKRWADHLARIERLDHASNDERGGAGENLWMGSAGYYSAGDMVGSFISERPDYRPGVFPDVSRTGNWRDVGHYTQVIWGGTKELGCAISKGRNNDILVCRYWPAGNTYGQEG